MPAVKPALWLVVAAALLAGCFVQDPSGQVMCFDSSECDSGEVCGDDHICYGNPPATPLQAQLDPPADPGELALAPTEVDFVVYSTGDFDERVVRFTPPITVSGRVVLSASPGKSVAAHIVFRRPSRIKGAPDYVVTAESIAGVADPAPSFSLHIVPTLPGETFSVTIYPDDSHPVDGTHTVAQLAPPYRQLGFAFETDTPDIVFPLGSESQGGATKTIRGRVLTAETPPTSQLGRADLVVRAYGQFGPLDPVEVASSRGVTGADGRFEITVPSSWEDNFEVRIAPAPSDPFPQVTLSKVQIGAAAEKDLGDIVLPAFLDAVTYRIPIMGEAPEGGLEPAVGARVSLRTVLAKEGDTREVSYQAEGVAGADGYAEVKLIPGDTKNRVYSYDVASLPNTPHRSLWGQMLEVGAQGGVLASGATLGGRVLFSGQLLDFAGLPQEDVNVTVKPSVRFTYQLLVDKGFDLTSEPFATTVTAPDGRFALWVEPDFLGTVAGYTLDFDPPAGSLQPRWSTIAEITPAPDLTGGQDLGDLWLPDAAYVRGGIYVTTGELTNAKVAGAQIRLYQEMDDASACALVMGATPVACQVPAILRAQATSDEAGHVRLVLPRL